MFSSTHMTIPCRSLQSDNDSSSSLHAILLVWTSSLCQELLQIMHHLFHTKPVCHKPYGLLKQLPIPKKPWNSISMDFIEKLPPSSGYTSILVILDCLSKQSLFILHVFSKHGVPSHVTSDRSMESISHFFRSLRTALDMKLHFTSGYHPKGDGQIE